MCKKYPEIVGFTKYEIKEDKISKKELREKIEKMLNNYPEDTMFDRIFVISCLGVKETISKEEIKSILIDATETVGREL